RAVARPRPALPRPDQGVGRGAARGPAGRRPEAGARRLRRPARAELRDSGGGAHAAAPGCRRGGDEHGDGGDRAPCHGRSRRGPVFDQQPRRRTGRYTAQPRRGPRRRPRRAAAAHPDACRVLHLAMTEQPSRAATIESTSFPGVVIRPYAPGDEVRILPTFNLVFREVCGPTYVDRELSFWHWEFSDRGLGRRISLAFAPDGTVVAQYAGVPLAMRTAFGPATFVHIVDSMVHPQWRAGLKRPGLFVETALPWFRACDEDYHDAVLFGYPVPTAERIGQRYLGYARLRVVDYLCRAVNEGSIDLPPGIAVEQVTKLGPEFDACAARFHADKACTTERDARYLSWRYLEVPGRPYEVF